MWNVVNTERGKKNSLKTNFTEIVVDDNGQKFETPKQAVHAMNARFLSAATACGAPKANVRSAHKALIAARAPADRSLRLRPFTADEVYRTITSRIPPKQSKDAYGLSMELLRLACIPLAPVLAVLYNTCVLEGTYPDPLKLSKVSPIYKGKGKMSCIDNYRPISIIPAIAKVFEYGLSNRLVTFLASTDALSDRQYAYREGRSTTSLAREVVSRVMAARERKLHVAVLCCDLSKAFDVADHLVLETKLKHYGIEGATLGVLTGLIRGRLQVVDAGDGKTRSDPLSSTMGVAQGSSVSNVLFSLLLNDLPDAVTVADILMYADDVAAIVTAPRVDQMEERLSNAAAQLYKWFTINGLALNLTKTHYIRLNLSGRALPTIKVKVNDFEIKEVQTTSFLGFEIDRGLTWENHIDKVCGKLGSACYALGRVSRVVSAEVARTCYFATVHSVLQYGAELWGRSADWLRVFRMQKRAIRALVHVAQDTSARPHFRQLEILTFPCMVIMQVAMFVRTNPHLYKKHSDLHNYYTRRANKLVPIQRTLVKSSKLTHVMGPAVYNKLPDTITDASLSLASFKYKLKLWLVQQTFYSFEEFVAYKPHK